MRIITGIAKGRKLDTLPGEEITRPTTERVKEGIFSAIQFELEGKSVLDLFAGCGQMALEALSRGASHAVLIDENLEAVEVIKSNARKTGFAKQCWVSRMDYSEYLKTVAGRRTFDIIFLDPPYAKKMKDEVLKKVVRAGILADGGIVVCETDRDEIDGDLYGLTLRKKYKYSRVFTYVFDYHKKDETDDEIEPSSSDADRS